MATIELVSNPADGAGPGGQFHAAELDNIYRALNGHGVIGHTLSATVTGGDMVVTLPAINAWVPDSSGGSVYVAYAGGAITISASDATNPRVDIIEIRSGATANVVTGTPTAETGNVLEAPMPPLSANAIMACKVKVGAAVTVIATDKVFGRAIDVSEHAGLNRVSKGSDIASAATITLPSTAESVFDITGTTTITALSSRPAGSIVVLQFDGALTLTHNATTLALVNAENYTTKAGDIFGFVSEGSGNWRELFHRLAEGSFSAWEHIDTTILAAVAASVSFASLPAAFRMFRLTAYLRLDTSLSAVNLRFNNDSGANYDREHINATGATITAASTVGAQQLVVVNRLQIAAGQNQPAVVEMVIAKQIATTRAVVTSRATDGLVDVPEIHLIGGSWRNITDLINRIDLLAQSGNFTADSRFVLEGVRTT